MTKASLGKSKKEETSKEENEEMNTEETNAPVVDEQALAEIEGSHLPAPVTVGSLALGQVAGEVSAKDLIIPRLDAVQNVGDLSGAFPKMGGALVYNKEHVLVEERQDLFLTVLDLRKTWEENLPYNPDAPMPKVFHHEHEVIAAGLWTEWRDNDPPPVREVATMTVLIEEPEGVNCPAFNLEFADKKYGLAQWVVRKTAYSRAAKPVMSAARLSLAKDGLLSGRWALHYYSTKVGNHYTYVPSMKLVGKNDPEFVQFIVEALS